eukprot:UN07373
MLETHHFDSRISDKEQPINTILLDQYITDIISPNLGLTINPELHNHRHFIIPTAEVYKVNNQDKYNNNDLLYYNNNSLQPFYYHPNQPLIENNILSTYQHLEASKHYNLINDLIYKKIDINTNDKWYY